MKRVMACLVLLIAANGCSGYRLVERSPGGGTYALLGDPAAAMVEARPEMEAHCGGPVAIVKEGEVPIGEVTETTAQSSTNRRRTSSFGTSRTQTTQQTEWRVEYRCESAEPAPTDPEKRPLKATNPEDQQ
jgi:hypothetical protein